MEKGQITRAPFLPVQFRERTSGSWDAGRDTRHRDAADIGRMVRSSGTRNEDCIRRRTDCQPPSGDDRELWMTQAQGSTAGWRKFAASGCDQ